MVCQTTKTTQPTTKQIDVTDLTPSEQRQLFCDCIREAGFVAFTKKTTGGQTFYVFTYKR